MTQARLELEEYTVRVLDVIKGKFGLKNRSEALNKFAEEYGEDYVDLDVNGKTLKYFDAIVKEHEAKYQKTSKEMTLEEVDKLLGIKE